jgi:C-terminal processing protease CtpA/Prc
MKIKSSKWVLIMLATSSATAFAQDNEDALESRMLEAERRLEQTQADDARIAAEERAEMARLAEQMKQDAIELSQRHELESEEYEARMREAEARMAEAARQVAELSMRQLPRVERIERVIRANRGPALGVTIGGSDSDDPVEGVEIFGVTPGGAAQDAGLRAGDVLTSINGESLKADNSETATGRLLDFMKGVEEGDELDVEYLRNGKSATVTITPRPIDARVFAFQFDGENFTMPEFELHEAPEARNAPGSRYVWLGHDGGFGDMEMVKLTERLGGYFGTDEGLLVVRAPSNEALQLEDGDVILNIDGRTPKSVSHALRILGSYQAGEGMEIEIMRDKRKRTLEIQMPDNRRSWSMPFGAPKADVDPTPIVLPVPDRT